MYVCVNGDLQAILAKKLQGIIHISMGRLNCGSLTIYRANENGHFSCIISTPAS